MGECVSVPIEEYNMLIRCRDLVSRIEEDIHEELNVKLITDKNALEKMELLHRESAAGKRKSFSKAEFLAGTSSD